jgi:hypothetical protein
MTLFRGLGPANQDPSSRDANSGWFQCVQPIISAANVIATRLKARGDTLRIELHTF